MIYLNSTHIQWVLRFCCWWNHTQIFSCVLNAYVYNHLPLMVLRSQIAETSHKFKWATWWYFVVNVCLRHMHSQQRGKDHIGDNAQLFFSSSSYKLIVEWSVYGHKNNLNTTTTEYRMCSSHSIIHHLTVCRRGSRIF